MNSSGNNRRTDHRRAAKVHHETRTLLHSPIPEPILAEVRHEMGLTQSQLAALLGCSVRAVQSYEQGWRRLPDHLTRAAVLLLVLHRRAGALRARRPCWTIVNCPERTRRRCVAFLYREGELCWMLTGTYCRGLRLSSWRSKWQACRLCKVLVGLLKKNS